MDYSGDGWGEFKKWIDGTYAKLRYAWVDEGPAYHVVAPDGDVCRVCSFNKADATEFEADYKDNETLESRTAAGDVVVADRELTLGQASFRRKDNGSEPMNIDGRATGTLVDVWDGEGSYWTPGGTGSQTAPSAHAGSNGWDTGATTAGNATTLDNGSEVDVDGTYNELRFWIQPKAFPVGSRPRIVWLDDANSPVGNALRIDDYTENMDLDVWQQIAIPIDDFALTEDVQKLRFRYLNASGQRYWLDDIVLVPTANGPFNFEVAAPDALTRYHLSMLVLMVSGPKDGWNSTTFANITALAHGLILRHKRLSDGEVLWRFNSKDNLALFGRYHPQDDIVFADDSMLVGFMVKPGKASVVITDDEVLQFVVRDDLSALMAARAYAHFAVEVIPS